MPGPCLIHDLRLSFIWVETFLDLVKNQTPPGANLAFLNHQNGYLAAFEETQTEGNEGVGPQGLQQPWLPNAKKKHKFWSFYLETAIPGKIQKDTVWQKLVPFYHEVEGFFIEPPAWLPGRMTRQSYFYPYSIALVLSVEINKPRGGLNLTLDEAIATAYQVRRTGRFQVTQPGQPIPQEFSLDGLAREELKRLRDFMLGPSAPPYAWSIRPPFTVATVVKGSGVERWDAPTHQVICFLDALTRWPTYDWDDPPPGNIPEVIPADQTKVNEGYPGDTLHIAPRGRAVWYPKHFLKDAMRTDKLSCYHKNLNLLSMQVDSLSDLVSLAAGEIGAGSLPDSGSFYETCVKRAATNLSMLYLGGGSGKNTYRSWSAKRQIEQNNYLDALNIVRDQLCNQLPLVMD